MRQVEHFVEAAGASLHTVTTVEISAWSTHDEYIISEGDVGDVLTPLINVCPLVKRLRVSGNIGVDLLLAFGAYRNRLTSIETFNVRIHTLDALSQLQPNVTTVHMRLAFNTGKLYRGSLQDHEHTISSCLSLHTLDVGMSSLTESTWRALPPGLRELRIGTRSGLDTPRCKAPPAGLQLPSLHKIYFGYNDLSLSELAGLLRAAPKLQQISMRDVYLPCSMDQIPYLVYVHDCLSAGLVISGGPAELHGEGLVLRLQGLSAGAPPESAAGRFFAYLPVLRRFRSVGVETAEPTLLAHLVRAFPRLRMLSIGVLMKRSSFPCVAVFPYLQHLELISKGENHLLASEVVALCLQIPTLLYLGTDAFIRFEKQAMAVLRTWGRRVRIEAIHVASSWPWPS